MAIPRRRAWMVGALLTSGCALVSGLDGITVVEPGVDGSSPDSPVGMNDAGADGVIADADAAMAPDVIVTSDARAGTAIDMSTMCSAYSSIATDSTSFSNKDFTVSFWFKPHIASLKAGRVPIVWRGGRMGGENGWMVGIENDAFIFCVADPNGGACTSSSGNINFIQADHLLHVGAISKVGANQIMRTLAIYVLDATNNATTHTQVATGSGQNNWNPPPGLSLGGALVNQQCTSNAAGVIDDLRLWSRLLAAQDLDANYKSSISCSDFGLVSYYKFDEGIGATTADCTSNLGLNLSGSYTWVPSPFP